MMMMMMLVCEDLDIRDVETSLYPTSSKRTATVKLKI